LFAALASTDCVTVHLQRGWGLWLVGREPGGCWAPGVADVIWMSDGGGAGVMLARQAAMSSARWRTGRVQRQAAAKAFELRELACSRSDVLVKETEGQVSTRTGTEDEVDRGHDREARINRSGYT
jgi:hypothetical protein